MLRIKFFVHNEMKASNQKTKLNLKLPVLWGSWVLEETLGSGSKTNYKGHFGSG
jgi:hypothetical protein